jgi:methionyl-tRNA synthetase
MWCILEREKILVTSALPYANGPIHLGHLSGAYLPADIYVRYHRLKGSDIVYVCGSDEHGVPITITADKEGVSPKVVIDRFHGMNKESFERFGMDFDIYSRTSLPIHHKTGGEFFLSFHDQGILNEKKTKQFYDENANKFLPDRYVEGTCPKCGFEEARSDECENCGAIYDPTELINPISKISGERPVVKETSHWYFPLGKYQERLEKYINENAEKYNWKGNVLQYCRGWFKEGLKDRAVTRDLDWGIKVPLDSADGKVLYVWFEAVLGYISAAKELSEQRNEPDLWRNYWQDKNTKYIAFIGKDNIVFHTIIFPAMLMAWNDANEDKFVLPQNVPANEFLNFEGKKFSKSRGWGIDVHEFLNKFPADPLRYALAANLPETKDTDFYLKEFQAKNNNELAAIFGNFVNRTFTFAHKHFEGKVPEKGTLSEMDSAMVKTIEEAPTKVSKLIESYKIRDAVSEMMNLARAGNKYFNDSEPWISVKSDKEKCGTTINICLNAIYTLAEIFKPVVPFVSEKLFGMLNKSEVNWFEAGKQNMNAGDKINKAEILFSKIDDEIIDDLYAELSANAVNEEEEIEYISFEEFGKADLRVAVIKEAEKIKKSNKLLKLQVSVGNTRRQIVAGIAKSYKPEDLIGRKIIIVYNLQPAKLFGTESQGMLLAVETADGKLETLTVGDNVDSGTKVR